MQTQEVKNQISGFLQKDLELSNNLLMQNARMAFLNGRLDHNYIRKLVIDCFKSHDRNAILLGSLLLQLDNSEIAELFLEIFS